MSWDARQIAMLAAMGLRVWPRESTTVVLQEEEAAEPQDAPQIPAAAAPLARPPEQRAPAPQAAVAALPQALRQATAKPVPEPEAAAAASQDLSALDLQGLRQSAAKCRACGLCQGRRLPVFGDGAAQAQCLVVVDAEGSDQGDAPLGGDAGVLLANILRAMGLQTAGEQANAFVTSPLKCRPQAGLAAGPAELQQCQPYLARQIELLRPRVILAMGPLSSQALLRSGEPLGKLRGRLHEYQGIPVVLTYHPAYLLRQQADKPRAWADLCLALTALDDKTPT
ncbi:uracil-DNA glycosylase [Paucibacter sp. KBW04]|uniref:uracil-DNA glycosylase n=1 Tax=Paucibacter sp. KBW04 TaxID=2153361 RepID=UPI000F576066|nr:uracil-DNA glycosylase [Paucibacter sp. KBW04]RQO53654.1 uracil-DNA glycosylase [Paucibacter sp. KBW04]